MFQAQEKRASGRGKWKPSLVPSPRPRQVSQGAPATLQFGDWGTCGFFQKVSVPFCLLQLHWPLFSSWKPPSCLRAFLSAGLLERLPLQLHSLFLKETSPDHCFLGPVGRTSVRFYSLTLPPPSAQCLAHCTCSYILFR